MSAKPLFQNRSDAGRKLADRVGQSVAEPGALVLALPRGGVPVAYEVATRLPEADLDVFLVRKLGVPGQEELAFGAVASGGIRVVNEALARELQLSETLINYVTVREESVLKEREKEYRQGLPAISPAGRIVVLVDDGLATGASMRAACLAVRSQTPKRIIVAVPVGARETSDQLQTFTDELICLSAPSHFVAVGAWYQNFSQTSDDEVHRLVQEARAPSSRSTL
jgi:putative phosphoribosyl transferase